MQHRQTSLLTSHLHKSRTAIQPHRAMAHSLKRDQIPPRSTAQIQNINRPPQADGRQQSITILADIMIPRAVPISLRMVLVMVDGATIGFFHLNILAYAMGLLDAA